MEDKKQYIEIWGDVVELRDLVRSIIISAISTMGLYFLAPSGNRTLQLFFGLAGAVIGFIISGLLTKPKRIIDSKDAKHHHTS
ncbi:hypothetical protein [Desemzia sp. FAM 23989]|uniref:hypothetical protein n=1 Tax=Desemzia sp. FAM 23989 TaxID=3259523 RepID=UPI0038853028